MAPGRSSRGRGGGPQGRGAPRPKRYDLSDDIRRIAAWCAVRAGLEGADAEDCAEAFLVAALSDDAEARLRPPDMAGATGTLHGPWVTTAAMRHALDWRRRLRRAGRRERPLPEGTVPAGHAPDAEAALMRAAAREALRAAVEALEPGPREMVDLFYFHGHSAAQIARTTRRTERAVEEALRRSRARLRSELGRHGWSESDLWPYLADAP